MPPRRHVGVDDERRHRRRRCNNPSVEDFSTAFQFPKSCSSITALDGPGAIWRVNFGGTGELAQDVSLAGSVQVAIEGALSGGNAYLGAYLYEGDRLVTWGRLNLAHNGDHAQYMPVTPGAHDAWSIPLRPTEDILRAGSTLRLEVRGVQAAETTNPFGVVAVRFDVHKLGLDMPGVELGAYEPLPLTARP